MGLPKPLGSYGVSFAEFELRRRSEKTRIGESRGTARSGAVAETLPSAEGAVDASFLSHGVEEDVVDFGGEVSELVAECGLFERVSLQSIASYYWFSPICCLGDIIFTLSFLLSILTNASISKATFTGSRM